MGLRAVDVSFCRDFFIGSHYILTIMSTLTIELPDPIREKVEELAQREGVAVDTFVTNVLAQVVTMAKLNSLVRERAKRGSAEQMLDVLSRVPRVPPVPGDEK